MQINSHYKNSNIQEEFVTKILNEKNERISANIIKLLSK